MERIDQQTDPESQEKPEEMGELWDGEKWVKSPLVPFGFYQFSPEHLPEPKADTSYWIID